MGSTGWVRRSFNGEKVVKMYLEDRKSSVAIAGELGISPQTVRRILRDEGCQRRDISSANKNRDYWSGSKSVEISILPDQDNIIIGSLLGDAGLHLQKSSINPHFSCGHKEEDKDYLFWKYEQLESTNLFKNPPFHRVKIVHGDEFPRWVIRSIQHPILRDYWNLFDLNNGKRNINIRILDKLSLLGLSVYYMDDGGLRGDLPTFYTYGYSKDQIEMFSYFLFKKWNLRSTLRPVKYGTPRKAGFIVHIDRGSIPQFKELVAPYILPCMSRKIPT